MKFITLRGKRKDKRTTKTLALLMSTHTNIVNGRFRTANAMIKPHEANDIA